MHFKRNHVFRRQGRLKTIALGSCFHHAVHEPAGGGLHKGFNAPVEIRTQRELEDGQVDGPQNQKRDKDCAINPEEEAIHLCFISLWRYEEVTMSMNGLDDNWNLWIVLKLLAKLRYAHINGAVDAVVINTP